MERDSSSLNDKVVVCCKEKAHARGVVGKDEVERGLILDFWGRC
jgi:hypothetical protein